MSATALTSLLEQEHAAVYAYGVLGARLADDLRPQARAAADAHRAARDGLTERLRALGSDVPGPQLAYAVTVADQRAALALAVRVETELGVRWRDLVAQSPDPDLRRLGTEQLTQTAVRAVGWRVAAKVTPVTVALPGQA